MPSYVDCQIISTNVWRTACQVQVSNITSQSPNKLWQHWPKHRRSVRLSHPFIIKTSLHKLTAIKIRWNSMVKRYSTLASSST